MLRLLRAIRRNVHSRRDFFLLCIAAGYAARALLLLKLLPLPKVLASKQMPDHRRLTADDILKLERYSDAVARRIAPRNRCLYRAASLYQILRRHGHPVSFHLGLRRQTTGMAGKLEGHAWLTQKGAPYLEPNPIGLDSFVETFSTSI